MFKNWKTSLAGLGSLFTGVALFLKGDTTGALAAITTGIGLICAKDNESEKKN